MARVTDTEVKQIIETEKDTTPFINTADLVVSESLESVGLSEERLKQITLWLAAHYTAITVERGGITFDKTGDASSSFGAKITKSGLASTRYGQQALVLDTSGTLATIDSTNKPALFRLV